jgi:Na+/proline symporter
MDEVAPQVLIDHPELLDHRDQVFPRIALEYLPPVVGIAFILGLIAAAYSSADSALTALTTSFCVDFLRFEQRSDSAERLKRIRFGVHFGFSVVLLIIIIVFNQLSNESVINELFTWAGYTYGPILGLFIFGLFTRLEIRDRWVIPICLATPVISFLVNEHSVDLLNGFRFGSLIILFNGTLTFLALLLIAKRREGALS